MADETQGSSGPPEESNGDLTLTNVRPGRGGVADLNVDLEPAFRPGQIVAGRYKVERFLAHGGMGEVYRVLDRELGESVALKTIRRRSAGDPVTLDRFRREIQIARKVSHRNVCRIFDLGRHGEGDDSVVFLTMELLEGVSLRARLREETMKPDEAMDAIRQLCAGLGAAHRKGIVHRDLKPSNIFLVPEGDETRVVIADFGLARTEIKGEGELTVTGTGEILGTPAYMAPEQIEGKKATTASDVYALGLVMYEMLTGAQPFEGESAFQIALAKMRDAPTSPSLRVQGLPLLWDRTILRCLERDPADRISDVEQIPSILQGERRIPRRRLRAFVAKRWSVVAVAVIVFGVLGLLAYRGLRGGPPGSGAAPFEIRRSVAVLGFENTTRDPDSAWISTAISDFLTTELGSGGEVRAVPGESVARARSELGIQRATTLGEETLSRLRERLAMDLVVLGSYTVLGDGEQAEIRLDTRVQDAAGGEIVILEPVTGARGDLSRLAIAAAAEIRRRFGLGAVAVSAAEQAFPKNEEAARLYAEGLVRLRTFDPVGARDRFQAAAAVEPESPLIWFELAEAWIETGYVERALEAARRSEELSGDLERELRLRIEGRTQLLAGLHDKAVESFTSLWLVYPDNLEYGIQLVDAQLAAGKVDDALETVSELEKLPAPLSEDPRIDLAEAKAAGEAGDAGRQAEAAQRVVEASLAIGSAALEAQGRLAWGRALRVLGELDRALEEVKGARAIEQDVGNPVGAANAAYSLALIHVARGEIDEAVAETETCLAGAREVGAKAVEGKALNLMGSIQLRQGDLAGAGDWFRQALELQREIGNRSGAADAANNVGLVQMWSGDFVPAIDTFTRVRADYRALGKPHMEAAVVMNLARIDAARGDLDGARSLFEEAVGLFRSLENADATAEALFGLGEVLLTQGDLEGARARHTEALQLRREHELASAVESEFALAGLALSEAAVGNGSYEEAVAELTAAADELERQGRSALLTDALNYLAEAQLGAGRVDDAEAALQRIRDLEASANSVTMMVLEINEAKVASRRGDHDGAAERLRGVMEEARRQASFGVEIEARLALAEVRIEAGKTDEARRLLDGVTDAATARGWNLIADKAAAMAEKLPNPRSPVKNLSHG